MKVLIDLSLVAALFGMSYFSDGWWALLAFMPFILLLVRHTPDSKVKKKTVVIKSTEEMFRYSVLTGGETITVECECPVQYEGAWAHFPDEIHEFGCHAKESYYMPQRITLLDPEVKTKLQSVE